VSARRAIQRGLAAALTAALASAAACSFPTGTFTIASPRKVPVAVRELGIVEGSDCTRVVFGIPLGPVVPTLSGALSDALSRAPGADSMINLSVFRDERYFVFAQQTCIRVKGMAASTGPESEDVPARSAPTADPAP
jgi:hypothetical protein